MSKIIDIQAVKIKHGIPLESTFIGYGIYRPDTKEYAILAIETEEESHWGWTMIPEFTRPFSDYEEVKRLVFEYNRAPLVVNAMFKHKSLITFISE